MSPVFLKKTISFSINLNLFEKKKIAILSLNKKTKNMTIHHIYLD